MPGGVIRWAFFLCSFDKHLVPLDTVIRPRLELHDLAGVVQRLIRVPATVRHRQIPTVQHGIAQHRVVQVVERHPHPAGKHHPRFLRLARRAILNQMLVRPERLTVVELHHRNLQSLVVRGEVAPLGANVLIAMHEVQQATVDP